MSSPWPRALAAAVTTAAIAVSSGLYVATQAPNRTASGMFGFSARAAARQTALEDRLLSIPSAERIRATHEFLTSEPHVAGSPRDLRLAEWVRDEWRSFGFDEVEIVEHEVLLPYPEEVSVSLAAPRVQALSMREDPIEGDPVTARSDVGIPHHAYSASGEVTAPLVYAGSGNPADYDWLASQGIDVKGKIALVRYSVPYSYRGFKALTAQKRGAAGILIYSDPADDGYGKGAVYPDGPWGPPSHIQRGGIVYDFLVPGDPLTPGWASVPGARRIEASKAESLPTIISAPLSWKDAEILLRALEGPTAPERWQGKLPFTYRVGGAGPATVRMRVKMDDRVRPIWTVVGRVRGAIEPERTVILGNHRDAWIFGGVDPSSGTASQMELARAIGTLVGEGHRPARTLVFASWDAEEFTLTSSTEWGEQFEKELTAGAVAYLNVDSSASGPRLSVAAVPALNRLITETAGRVTDPAASIPLVAAWRDRRSVESGALPTGASGELVNNRLGSGSDYTVFLNFLGVPVADLTFDGPYGVYHSIYDNHLWVSRHGDPGFRYHRTMAGFWGVLALRLANAELLPLDYAPYADRVLEFLTELEKGENPAHVSAAVAPARAAAERLRAAALSATRSGEALLQSDTPSRPDLASANGRLMRAERAFLDPAGIPGRPWYRHLIYAPKFTYAPELLPGLSEALAARDNGRLAAQVARLTLALDRATRALTP